MKTDAHKAMFHVSPIHIYEVIMTQKIFFQRHDDDVLCQLMAAGLESFYY